MWALLLLFAQAVEQLEYVDYTDLHLVGTPVEACNLLKAAMGPTRIEPSKGRGIKRR